MATAGAVHALPCAHRGAASSSAVSRACCAPGLTVARREAVAPGGALRGVRCRVAALRVCRRRATRRGAAGCALVVAAGDTQAADALWRWLGTQGVDTSAVRPAAVAEGLGLVSTWCVPQLREHVRTLSRAPRSAVRSGETVLSVPRAVWLTPAAAAASPLGPHVADQPPWVQLALFLLHERADRASRWAPYIALLPEQLDTPVFWSDAELAELQGSQLGSSASSYRSYLASVWDGLLAGPVAAAPAVFPASTYNAESFAWAFSTLRARCLPPADAGPGIALIPGLDLVNHASDAGPAWTPARGSGGGLLAAAAAAAGVGGKADAETAAAMALVAGRAYAAGEQLYGSYGEDKLDSQIALDYGFVDAAAPQPGYLLQLSVPETDRFVDDKLDVLEVAKLPASPQYALRPGAAPPPALLTYLRLLNLSGTDAFLLEPLFRDACWNVISEPISLVNERASCEGMIDGCSDALRGYATSAAQDEQGLRAPGLTLRSALALRVRLGEKRALQATLEAYQTMLAAAPRLEYYHERRLRSLKLLDEGGKTTYDPFNDSFGSW